MIGCRILKRHRAVASSLVARAGALPAANVSDCMNRMVAGGPTLKPMHAGGVMAGPALTVKTRPGDNLMLHKALDLAAPGDIIVCDAGGDLSNALFGELMLAHARKRGVAGIVINGAIRDAAVIRAGSFPVFAAGVTHRGPYKDGPGEINVPVSLGGMVVEPGDLVLGDDDGVVSVPFAQADTVLKAAEAKKAQETKTAAEIEAGTWDRAWIDVALKKLGCHIEQ